MTHPRDRAKDTEREARRRRVAALLLAGVTDQRTIAEQVGASQPTISRDIRTSALPDDAMHAGLSHAQKGD